jgi:DNA-binding response OmpR family regulator
MKKVKKVLIVEDDKRVAQALELRVRSAGYETCTAYDALGGVMAAAKVKPDAVLLDINIPAGNGFSVAQRIQSIMSDPAPIIFITASRKPELFERAAKLGAAGFVEKPYDPVKLLALLRQVLEEEFPVISGPRTSANAASDTRACSPAP